MQANYNKRVFYLILFTAVFKLIIAGLVELGNDEVYYYTYALQPDWSYFDHPPMVGLLIRLSTLNLIWLNGVSMRLGAIISCAFSTYFIFETGKLIHNERTGWLAALIYNCSVYTGVIAGLFILPDSPQMPFWTASLFIMARIIVKDNSKKTGSWLLLGLMIGLASLSKVHGLYLWAGFGLYILIKKTNWLLNWRMYAGVLVTLICLVPVVYWNFQNDFITYRYHSERVMHHEIQWGSLLREILGEFAYQNPVIFILIIVSIIYFIRKKTPLSFFNNNIWIFCMSIPMLFLFWGVALFNPTLPHWSGPAYIPLFFVAAKYLDSVTGKIYPWFINLAGGLVVLILITGTALTRLAPFNLGSQQKENYGEYGPTLDLSGWQDFGRAFTVLVQKDIAGKKMVPGAPIIINKWFPGGHIEFYVAGQSHQPVIGVGQLDDLHKFVWLNKQRKQLQLGDDAYCIVPSNLPFNPVEAYSKYFNVIEQPVVINQMRGGKVVRYFYIYRMKQCKQVPETVLP